MENLQTLTDEISTLCNVTKPDSFSEFNTESKYSIIRLKLFETIDDMLEMQDWRDLEKIHTFTIADHMADYDQEDNQTSTNARYSRLNLPSDYLRVVKDSPIWANDTFYDATPVRGLRDWALFADYNFSWPEKFRINPISKSLDIIPTVSFNDEGQTVEPIRLAYISANIYEHPNGTLAQEWPNDSDYHLILDNRTVIYGTVGRYLTHQGRNENYYWAYYNEKIKQVKAKQKPDAFVPLGGESEYISVAEYKLLLEKVNRQIRPV